jgi:hypothetical protein
MRLAPAARRLSSLARMTPQGGVHGSSTTTSVRQWRAMPLLTVSSCLCRAAKAISKGGRRGRFVRRVAGTLSDQPLQVAGEKKYFKTGLEAVQLLVHEAKRRDQHKKHYLEQFESFTSSLSAVFDRSPRYAWLAKIFLEPERSIQFRVSYLDDSGVVRTHRGYRVQYSSTLGPYEGPLHFGAHVDSDMLKGAFADDKDPPPTLFMQAWPLRRTLATR